MITGEDDRAMIRFSLWEIQAKTCLLFLELENPNYIYVDNVEDEGCYSYVGYIGRNQTLNLASGCMYASAIKHEFLHAIGFQHQQSSADRDNYVTVNTDNVKPGNENNFDKLTNTAVFNFGVAYDFKSVMHYDAYAFSKNEKPTITSKKFKLPEDMGLVDDLSEGDITKINTMYGCKV